MIEKPPFGSPCNSCGRCCEFSPCVLSRSVFKISAGPCPALGRDEDGKSYCGLVVNPRKHAPTRTATHGVATMRAAALTMIGSGAGCDAQLVDEPVRAETVSRMVAEAMKTSDEAVVRAMRVWGITVDLAKAEAIRAARVA